MTKTLRGFYPGDSFIFCLLAFSIHSCYTKYRKKQGEQTNEKALHHSPSIYYLVGQNLF